jgi:DNA-binding NarL/FixJ family response regulator
MPPSRDTVIVVARPGLLRESLVAFLTAMPEVGDVVIVDDPAMVAGRLRPAATYAIVVDAGLGQTAVTTLLQRLRADAPAIRRIVLTDDAWPHEPFLSAGADEVLVKGFLGDRLRRAVLGDVTLSE